MADGHARSSLTGWVTALSTLEKEFKVMRQSLFTTVVMLLWLALAGLASPVAHAEEIDCTGFLGVVTVDNLRVPQNSSCTLDGTRMLGTLKVEEGATLNATRIEVVGNVQAEGAAAVNVSTNSTVGGSIQIEQGQAAHIENVRVNADILFDSNRESLFAISNTVGGNIQVFQNLGGVTISGNVIDGNLQCKQNTPAPTGGANVVHGSAEDQCENLDVTLTVRAYLSFITR